MKKILGLDLGTNSIGWAYVHEADKNSGKSSSIQKTGVRVNPLTVDEQANFEKGKSITTNANRTLARTARRNLQRFKLRREHLIQVLKENKWIDNTSILAENGNQSTFETYHLRAKAAKEKIELEEFARVLLMINKKRGFKSSRKVNNKEEGNLIDGMEVAKKMYKEQLTPGQYVFKLLKQGIKIIPEFYRSDLELELEKVWTFQKHFYPEILTEEFRSDVKGKGQKAVSASFWIKYQFNTAENKGTREEKKLKAYEWRSRAISEKLGKEEMAFVIADIHSGIHNSSGYLGAISDRSKELYFNEQTVGQYLYDQLRKSPHVRLKNQVFYRQDYLDEFEKVWSTQQVFYPKKLSHTLKEEIRDIVIFYQRKLKSQKGLISFCEFEQKTVKDKNGNDKIEGSKVAPKSSPLFQEFKIWQTLHHVRLKNKITKDILELSPDQKDLLFEELNFKGRLSAQKILEIIEHPSKEWELNYKDLEGNNTQKALCNAYLQVLDIEGYDVKRELEIKLNKDAISIEDLDVPAKDIKRMIHDVFEVLGIDTSILYFNGELEGNEFEQQKAYKLWHLLYSYEEDNSTTGMEHLHYLLQKQFGFNAEHAKFIGQITFQLDYGNLSSKAMRRIYPFIKESQFSTACEIAGYRHSKHSLTKEELAQRPLKSRLDILKKNSLRNPVVEKILNQMINVVNTLIDTENDALEKAGKPRNFEFDEIRIELARGLKSSADERAKMTSDINKAKSDYEKIFNILQTEDGIKNPTRNDIIRYRLYQELKNNGYKNLYTNEYIERKDLFTKKYDIDHIIPQARLFDDSFSNKTLIPRQVNSDKGDRTAYDYIDSKFGSQQLAEFEERIKMLYDLGNKNKEEGISKAKYQKLFKQEKDIGDGFIERDLRDSQYIAKKAKEILFEITRCVLTTSGSVTSRLREDWGLINVMKELNLDKYRILELTQFLEMKDGNKKEVIKDWTKRNDQRHHAMDALTVAFTKQSHNQYLNFLNARKDEEHTLHHHIMGIEKGEMHVVKDDKGNRKYVFNAPIANFREVVKEHLLNVLISYKAKNKVVTKNNNIIAGKNKVQQCLTPRGQLHKETIYGKIQQYAQRDEKISGKFDEATIHKVSNPVIRALLLERLAENGGDPKKAFAGKNTLSKNPIYLDTEKTCTVPEKVKLVWFESDYTIRKEINPDNFKDFKSLEKIIDKKVRSLLEERLEMHKGNAKEAFSDLIKYPIWLNKEEGIAINRVTISGVKNAEALHFKKDHFGTLIRNENGHTIPTDFVSTGNNHHVAIYRDDKGELQENVISFYEAVARVNAELPIIDKTFRENEGWVFLFTMKQNEMFIFPKEDFNPLELDLLDSENYKKISPNLFRVQKCATKDYVFRHHLETKVEDNAKLKNISWKREGLKGIKHIIKVRINHLGQIVSVGEY